MFNVKNIKIGYEDKIIIDNLSVSIKKSEIVSILGPNGSGKSTLLKSLSRILKIKQGDIYIGKKNMKVMSNKEISRQVALLAQHNVSLKDIKVKDLIYYGRIPHKGFFEGKNKNDDEIVTWAMRNTGLESYKDKLVSNLSGGERQRVWLAMALCQKPDILLLDEPTTYLDISHQLELMELVRDINKKFKMTIIMVLHDINQASKYSDRLIIMNNGSIVADGHPNKVISEKIIKEVYKVKCDIDIDPISKKPRIHPIMLCRRTSSI
ncbi:TPA: ABC transporter ATP-binding protein [Clostridioides difficile]|nr:ABC transporter ATP-binding protein [Clostridioides difficile]